FLSNSTADTATYTLSLHDALPIFHEQFDVLNDYYFRGGPKPVAGSNICHLYEYEQGEPEQAFADAFKTVEETFSFPGIYHYAMRSEEHTSELQSRENLVCRLLLEK